MYLTKKCPKMINAYSNGEYVLQETDKEDVFYFYRVNRTKLSNIDYTSIISFFMQCITGKDYIDYELELDSKNRYITVTTTKKHLIKYPRI